MNLDDTIVAIATPPGRGGIGVIRLAGPEAHAIAMPMLRLKHDLEPGRAVFGELIEPDSEHLGTDALEPGRLPGRFLPAGAVACPAERSAAMAGIESREGLSASARTQLARRSSKEMSAPHAGDSRASQAGVPAPHQPRI